MKNEQNSSNSSAEEKTKSLVENIIHESDHDGKDHYHGDLHYEKNGAMDRIDPQEFQAKTHFKFTKKNLTFKLTISGVILALSVVISALDIIFESFLRFPIGQISISFRFLDLIILLMGISVLGPLFGSFVGLLEPIFHNLIHGMEHGWIQPLTDSLTNILVIFLTWAIYYLVFKNSPYHRDPNKRKDWLKRLSPGFLLIIFAALISTAALFLALYIQEKTGWGFSNIVHDHHERELSWDAMNGKFVFFYFAIFGFNLLRYFLAYSIFIILEGRLRVVNHRYR